MNNVCLIGNIVRDFELRTTTNGVAYCGFTIAINRMRGADGESKADFIPIKCWRVMAENAAKYLGKGSKVGVVGKIQTSSYEDKDGKKVYTTEVVADNLEYLIRKEAGQQEAGEVQESPPPSAQDQFIEVTDELPF